MTACKAPNRLLDLADLEAAAFTAVNRRMDELLLRFPQAYLHPSKRWEYPWAMQRLGALAEGSRVLDAGCGGSIFPLFLASCGWQVVGCDCAVPRGLAGAQSAVEYVDGNLVQLPFADGAFDAAFCISVIEHLGHAGAVQAMAELHRILKPGARLLLTTDYYEDASAELWHETGERFAVDWSIFDRHSLRSIVLDAPGWHVEGDVDLTADWGAIEPAMVRFHGYRYTSVGVTLLRH
jgi:2-polyprenyl-3-methyl-5-hydroxy-6-metoxy-1,4-benzoquinol methylase